MAHASHNMAIKSASLSELQDPVNMFDHPLYINSGNLFWPDAWQGKVQDTAYSMHGLRAEDTKVGP